MYLSTFGLFALLLLVVLTQMFIGDVAKLIQDAFELAKEKNAHGKHCGAIIFIDELNAIGLVGIIVVMGRSNELCSNY